MQRLLVILIGLAFVPQGAQNQGERKTYKVAGDCEVEVIKGIAYYDGRRADPVRHKLDLYLPKGQKDFPVLVFVHGGTWKWGSKDLYAPLGKTYAKNGIG